MSAVVRILPLHYIHVLDNNSGVTRLIKGPSTFTKQDHETLVKGPSKMIIIPTRHCCIIDNPVVRDKDGYPVLDSSGNFKVRHGDQEIRFHRPPFPLLPGESLFKKVKPLVVVPPDSALRLVCVRDFVDSGVERKAGDAWLWQGPGTYYPQIEVEVKETVSAVRILENTALWLRAQKEIKVDGQVVREAGEEWLERKVGSYLPHVDEKAVSIVEAEFLTNERAIHLCAKRTYTDVYGVERKAGSRWLVSVEDAPTHIVDVYETLVTDVKLTVLTEFQYCIVENPIDSNGVQHLGGTELRSGPTSFFRKPGEKLVKGIRDIVTLGESEALLLLAQETFKDETGEQRGPGDRWMIYGPRSYIPPMEVSVVERRKTISLDTNEGIYIRDLATGHVHTHMGESYMLTSNQELWEKDLPAVVEELLKRYSNSHEGGRDKTKAVSLQAPHNTAVQVYDYRSKTSRVVFGPELVVLGPEEHFTLMSLSGGSPKRPHVLKDICLMLGPSFTSEIVTVDTSDHARLQLRLAFKWHFEVDKSDPASAATLFQVPDFVGDFCKAMASRIRGAVAKVSFDTFHRNSAKIIRGSVFGVGEDGKPNKCARFTTNGLVISDVDIQSVEPVDHRTRESLQKSVQLAIEITTKAQEAEARHKAANADQEARGELERQKISDEAAAEEARKDLLSLRSESKSVEVSGHAQALAQAKATAAQIEAEAMLEMARLQSEALTIKTAAEIEVREALLEEELRHRAALDGLEVEKLGKLAEVEKEKFAAMVGAIGSDTLAAIADAGPELQAKLLNGLGLESFLITDGKSPINLFRTAEGLIPSLPPSGA